MKDRSAVRPSSRAGLLPQGIGVIRGPLSLASQLLQEPEVPHHPFQFKPELSQLNAGRRVALHRQR